jgi:hypothetical protein
MALLHHALRPPVFTESGFVIDQQAHRSSANWPKLGLGLVRLNCGMDQACGVCLAVALRMSCELSFHLLQDNLISSYYLREDVGQAVKAQSSCFAFLIHSDL